MTRPIEGRPTALLSSQCIKWAQRKRKDWLVTVDWTPLVMR